MDENRGDDPSPERVPFARPDITEEEIAEVTRVIRSGWLTSGPEVERFEQEFATATDAPYALALNSATAALHLSMVVLGVGPGDGVIVPSITFAATAEVVLYTGARPLIVDVERTHGMLSAEILNDFFRRECRSEGKTLIHKTTGLRIRAMIPVHLGGRPAPMDDLHALAREHDMSVVEDAAHSFPSSYKGRKIGSVSELTAFSFYATKNLTTGEGGMLTVRDEETAARLKRLRNHGVHGQTYGRKRWHYDVLEQGFKYNMSDMNAAMGRVQLRRSGEMYGKRKAIAHEYARSLSGLPGIVVPPFSEHEESYHLFMIEVEKRPEMNRDILVEALYGQGVGTSLHFIPLYRHTLYRERFGYVPEDFPVSEEIYGRVVSLPLYSAMTESQINRVTEAVARSLERR